MSNQFLTGSICLTDIPQNLITVSPKNGKKYLNIAVSQRKEVGKFGETHTIAVSVPKEQRKPDDKPTYIGNLKAWESNTTAPPTAKKEDDDDLPF